MSALADHFPTGCWHQPDGSYAGQCSCGGSFAGASYAEAKAAWAEHATPPASKGVEVRAGWKLVPEMNTAEMCEAYEDLYLTDPDGPTVEAVWSAMLAAAPTPSNDTLQGRGEVEHCAIHLRQRAKGFRKEAFEQGKRVGPLAMGFEMAADEILSVAPERNEADDIAWLSGQRRLSLSFYSPMYGDDDDQSEEWRVTRESGPINDREWDVVGRGQTVDEAISAARAALQKDARHDG